MIAAALFAAAAGAAAAQQAAPSNKVGFVGIDRVMRDSVVSQQAQKELEADFKKREQAILSGPKGEIEKRRGALLDEIGQRRDEALKAFLDKANAAVRRIAEQENLDAVFAEGAYAAPRVDITDKVIKAIDAAR
jgi:outer membrane protein